MTLIHAMAAMVFYIFAIALFMFYSRVNAGLKGKVRVGYFKQFDAATYSPPEFQVRLGRHYDNLFQLPILYLVTCLYCLHRGVDGPAIVGVAWVFVFSRVLHTYIHLGANHLGKRAFAFALGWVAVITMWILSFVL